MKIHLCIDARWLKAPGIGTFLRGILRGFSKNPRYSLTVLHSKSDEPFLDTIGPHARLEIQSAPYSLKEQIELSLKIPSCDLYFSPHFNVPYFPIRAKKRLTTIHDFFHLVFRDRQSILKRIYASLIYRKAAKSDLVVLDSNFIKQQLFEFFERDGICIPLGIDQKVNFPDISHYKLPKRYFLCVGSDKFHKNLQRVVEAFQALAADVHLVLIGSFSENCFSGSRIIKPGYVKEEELASFYRGAEALVFPSLYEGFGYPPLEAMRARCAVIASSRASLAEVCQDAVLYVDPEDIRSIQQGMMRILEERSFKEELIAKGEKHVIKFPIDRTLQAYEALIEKSVSGP